MDRNASRLRIDCRVTFYFFLLSNAHSSSSYFIITMSDEIAVGRQDEDVQLGDANDEDAEIIAMKKQMEEMEAEAAKLREMTAQSEAEAGATSAAGGTVGPGEDEKEEVDNRSIYVGNVSRAEHADVASHPFPDDLVIPSSLLIVSLNESTRSTTEPHLKRYNNTSAAAAPLTASRSSATNSLVTPKGTPTSNSPIHLLWPTRCS